ncbi:sucrase ferredoxin [Dermatophilus congolensis]|uniref:Uncharacterized protein conserved in bacteria containing thioredoxin-like domain n=2 Tax=Dermatophilus congolensis TaxID=1863 RepID=A0A239VNW0_9MICO|nr:sucrase ferredoxin [Dermatophilus congolensis]MBO3129597.1 hypothetical protein [Dermatophilus congolensis]MBO3131770.1 hypothetical protein [Dermatophilus congolensis]MBO3134073.1 hypothetical protein [Dermatophilus congolensis]MBO3136305.1 hypothetical protein [Dermatophilus congolensis]MBO3138553.1 hypothetical protein [Dermatophilus congolensis]
MAEPPTTPQTPCSIQWDKATDPAWGTTSPALFWIAMEQRGPWGRKAFTQSRLDPTIGQTLEKNAETAGGRALLIRQPSAARETATPYPRHVFLSGGMTQGTPWLLHGTHPDPAVIANLPFEAAAAGDINAVREHAPWLTPTHASILLICTNSKRDQCCAKRGRPIVDTTSPHFPERIWDCTHTGGHRFAPTAIVLPHGLGLARLNDTHTIPQLLTDTSGNPSDTTFTTATTPHTLTTSYHLRGLSHLPAAEQAADAYIRTHLASTNETTPILALTTTADATEERTTPVTVTHTDGRTWNLLVRQTDRHDLPASCGGAPITATAHHVEPAT